MRLTDWTRATFVHKNTNTTLAYDSLSSLEEARLSLLHVIDGWGGGEEGVVGGVEGGRAAVALLNWQRTGAILQWLRRGERARNAVQRGKLQERRKKELSHDLIFWTGTLNWIVMSLLSYLPILVCVIQWACVWYRPKPNAHLLKQGTAGIVSHSSDRMPFFVNNTRERVCVLVH